MVETTERTYSFGKIGRGLSSLINEPKAAEDAAPATAENTANDANEGNGSKFVDITKLRPRQYQPRTVFNPEGLKELADSIAKNGIIQPIVVRSRNREEFEIIAGERRWRAARMLNMQKVPVVVRQLSDREVIEVALVENIQRRDLNPLEEAYGYRRLLGEFGYTQEDLSRTVGKSRSHIANLLRLLSLPEAVKNLLNDGALGMSHARTLIGCDNAEAIAKRVIEFGLSVRETEILAQHATVAPTIANEFAPDSPEEETASATPQATAAVTMDEVEAPAPKRFKATKRQKNQDILSLEEMITRNLGSIVDIRARGKKGEIRIRYKSLQELDAIIARLG